MPEGHTIHRLALDHTRDLAGERLAVTSPQGRAADVAARVTDRRLLRVEAWGKHLFYVFQGGTRVHVHLGLFGRFRRFRSPAPPPRPTVRLRLEGARVTVDLVGATVSEAMSAAGQRRFLERLGPDLLRDDARPERAWERLRSRRTGIGRALLDQSVLAGVGNVYRAEALFVNGVHPELSARDLTRAQFDALWDTLVRMLRQGVKDRRIRTVDGAHGPGERTWVYKQPRCLRCRSHVRRWDLGGRWAYACETCQPPPAASSGPARATNSSWARKNSSDRSK